MTKIHVVAITVNRCEPCAGDCITMCRFQNFTGIFTCSSVLALHDISNDSARPFLVFHILYVLNHVPVPKKNLHYFLTTIIVCLTQVWQSPFPYLCDKTFEFAIQTWQTP